MSIFVLDQHGKALMPCTEKRARRLLDRGRARVHRLLPMVIRLVDRLTDNCAFQALRLKLDPGSKTTGLVSVRETETVDAACVGQVEAIEGWARPTLTLTAMGRGSYQRTRLDSFPKGLLMRNKRVQGFGTGDMLPADVPKGLMKAAIHWGRVAGSFNIPSQKDGVSSVVQGISHQYCPIVQRNDGYGYFLNPANHTARDQVRPKATNALHSALYLPGMNAGVSRAF